MRAVRDYALPKMQIQGPILAWIVDDTGFPTPVSVLKAAQDLPNSAYNHRLEGRRQQDTLISICRRAGPRGASLLLA
jgi:hypothetical protein